MGKPERTRTDDQPVTVVIVNYNAGSHLLQCLESVFSSTVPTEVILCDNASTDGSGDRALAAFPGIRLIANERNLGFARAANQGLQRARGAFRLLLNPDCILQPDTLERTLQALAAHPQAGMAGCRILNPDGSEQRGCRRRLPDMGNSLAKAAGRQQGSRAMDLHRSPLPKAPLPVEAISGAFMLLRAQALESVGLLDEEYFLHCEDLDWCKRFHDAGWQILFVPDAVALHHQGTCSRATPVRVSWHKHRGMARYYRKHLAHRHNPVLRGGVLAAIYLRFLLKLGSRKA